MKSSEFKPKKKTNCPKNTLRLAKKKKNYKLHNYLLKVLPKSFLKLRKINKFYIFRKMKNQRKDLKKLRHLKCLHNSQNQI